MRSKRPAALARHRGRARGRSRAGFTLLEVLLAVALFAIAFTVLAASYVNVLNAIASTNTDRALDQEMVMIRNQIELEPDREVIEAGGDLPSLTHGMVHWTATVTPSEEVADLFRVEFTAEFEGDGDTVPPQELTQSLYLLRTQWMEPTEREALRQKTRERLDELHRERPL